MTIIDSRIAPVFAHGNVRFTGLASPSRGTHENSVWRVSIAPGSPHPGTHQVTREEVFVALSGTAEVMLEGRTMPLEAGSALVVPALTDFSLANPGNEPFEAIVVLPVGGEAVIPGQAPFVPPWAR